MDYHHVTFVFMTWRVSGVEECRAPEVLNGRIRQHCIDIKLVLYDFGDIERYDPDGTYFSEKRVDDKSNYDNDFPFDSGPIEGN